MKSMSYIAMSGLSGFPRHRVSAGEKVSQGVLLRAVFMSGRLKKPDIAT